MNDKHFFILDVISFIDEEIIDKNLKKRFELWFKKGRRKSRRWIPIVAAAACLCIIISALALLLPTPDGKQIPVYHGMTVSNEPPQTELMALPDTSPALTPLSFEIPAASSSDMIPLDEVTPPHLEKPAEPPKPGKDESDTPDIVFGETYYALKNEDIYIYIHLSNPDDFEILSFTLNGKKYSSNMFEYGSDLETLILKYNVGNVDGLQEYTIDAIKYVDGERIKDVRMDGDRTVKVFVNDEQDLLQFNAQLSFMTLTIAPTKPLLSLALYEGETLLRELSPTDTTITDLPFDKRLILKATYSDGVQTRSAQHIFDTQPLSQGLIIDEDGVIRGIGSCTDMTLYINNPVGAEAFSGNKSLVAVYMGPGVTSIGEKAFYECSTLKTVQLPDTLTELMPYAFSNSGITEITIPATITSLQDRIFQGCTQLSDVTLPNTLTQIGAYAFSNCTGLKKINLPDSLTTIENRAFQLCQSLTAIQFPDTLTSLGEYAFCGCISLSNVTVPGSVGVVRQWTFNGTHDPSSLQSITLSHGITSIEFAALADNPELTHVTLPSTITNLGQHVFNLCTKLTEVHFEGTKDQWKNITKNTNWKGQAPFTVVHCSDGDLAV